MFFYPRPAGGSTVEALARGGNRADHAVKARPKGICDGIGPF